MIAKPAHALQSLRRPTRKVSPNSLIGRVGKAALEDTPKGLLLEQFRLTNMSDAARPSEVRLRDPLSAVTRAERKALLAASAVGIVIARSGLVPAKISALGIEFDNADQRALLSMLSLIVGYFVAAFLIYAASDLVAWRVEYINSMHDWRRRQLVLSGDERSLDAEVEHQLRRMRGLGFRMWRLLSRPVMLLRAMFEFALPVVVGIYASTVLARTPAPRPRPSAKNPVVVAPGPVQPPSRIASR